jgi:hypothetical protein
MAKLKNRREMSEGGGVRGRREGDEKGDFSTGKKNKRFLAREEDAKIARFSKDDGKERIQRLTLPRCLPPSLKSNTQTLAAHHPPSPPVFTYKIATAEKRSATRM